MIVPAYLTTGELDRQLSLGINLAQTNIPRAGQLAVGMFQLPVGYHAEVAWLSLYWVSLADLAVPAKITAGLAAVFAGVWPGIQTVNRYTGHPLVYAPRELPGYEDANPYGHHYLYEPGHYTVLAVNNLSNVDVQVQVTCAVNLYRP